jgi:N-carbamoylputrescine amidase
MDANIATVSELIREAADRGAQVILPPELFQGPYFCKTQEEHWFAHAYPAMEHPCVTALQKLAAELDVAIPVSIFERDGPEYYNSLVMLDAAARRWAFIARAISRRAGLSGEVLLPPRQYRLQGLGHPHGKVGVGICWDQWFPEAARAMALMGAEVLLYPTAIGAEPHDASLDTAARWRRAMQGHAVVQCDPGRERATGSGTRTVRCSTAPASSAITPARWSPSWAGPRPAFWTRAI